MREEGRDVIGFGAGEPDFDTPEHVKAAAVKALADGLTKYTPSSGLPVLRRAIADKFRRDNGLDCDPSQIIVSCGAKHSCYNAVMAVCDPGDEVIIPAPYWVSYPEMVKLAEARPVILHPSGGESFKIAPEALRRAITDRTRMFILNSPGNPSGMVYAPEEIRALGDVCVERGIYLLSDEIYEKILYEGAVHRSVAAFSPEHRERTIVVNGFAKAWSMTGWRLGFLAAPEPVARAIDAIQSHSTSNPTSFAQMGGVAALEGPRDHLAMWVAEFDLRRRHALERLAGMDGIRCIEPLGAFYLFIGIEGTGLTSGDFCRRLLEEEQVAMVPGSAFGDDSCVRMSYATGLENIRKGLDRMERFVSRLP